jgi:hypothetical protein
MSLRDLGKVAWLVADGGRGIIPAEFIAQMTRRQIVSGIPSIPAEAGGYGYQMWMIYEGWDMCGMGGQIAVYHPEKKLLLCTIADTRLDSLGIQKIYSAFYEELLGHMDDPEQPGEADRLRQRLADLQMISVPHAGGNLPLLKRAYAMEPNEAGLQRIILEGNSLQVTWSDSEETFRWEALGENCTGLWTGTDYPVITSAGLTADGVLQVRCQLIHHAPCGLEMFIHESGGTVSVRMHKANDPLTRHYDGIFWGAQV